MLLDERTADGFGAKLVASCDLFEAGKSAGPEGQAQWQAAEPFCSKAWEDKAEKDASLHAGPHRLSLGSLQKLMEARIDARFEENYQHLVDKDGWLDKAFVNYFA